MPITQTSLKSKNYNALGIDEIADDITNLIEEVNILSAGGGSDYTETIVNISSAQLKSAFSMGGIELVPAAGAGTYFDIQKVILEFTYIASAYTTTETYFYVNGANAFPADTLCGVSNRAVVLNGTTSYADLIDGVAYSNQMGINVPIILEGWNGDNLATGNGTLRVKIYHKTIIFGA